MTLIQHDHLQLFEKFAIVWEMVVIHIKNQALLQMQDVNVTQYDPEVQPIERGRNVYIQHSLHPEVTIVDQTGSTRRPSNDQVLKRK
ncbi:hypothetical protein O6H91_Y234400 [Diphasiastrum complanatum]|nr:hypothetical protein O6H91_Y234400 [Diphasiastrum complanatum]